MSARRQPSTTSLSKYIRTQQADDQSLNRSLDFCNAFWGMADEGVDVLFARMRGAARTVDELRNFWKERWTIEEEYAKKLAKLAKTALGKDEIGDLRSAFDVIKVETDQQASFHLKLAQTIRNDLENQTANFHSKQLHHKKTYQTGIERQFKAKQTQESYVLKAREKYESDCMRINSYTAQATLVQGRELEKLQLRLQRTEQTVQANERDFANFSRALADTTAKWELDWKAFCDSCQDLEEERLDFLKDIMWAYANAVSTVCVSDDESCEKVRLSLEIVETEKEMEGFVRDYGTGPLIPDPPAFVNYTDQNAVPSASAQPTSRAAQFPRSTQRARPPPPEEEEPQEPPQNMTGIGTAAGVAHQEPEPSTLARSNTRRSSIAPSHINGNGLVNGSSPHSQLTRKPTNSYHSRNPASDIGTEPADPRGKSEIRTGNPPYDTNRSPQRPGASGAGAAPSRGASPTAPGELDPLEKQVEELRNTISSSGTIRRNPTVSRHATHDSTSSQLSAGPSASPRKSSPDYRNSAEQVVGGHPYAAPAPAPSVSPKPPAAVMMRPGAAASPHGQEHITGVMDNYQQSLPGERKQPTSRRNSYISPPMGSPSNANTTLGRPPSQLGHAGVGAHGMTPSTSPQPISRSTSPAMLQNPHRNSSSYITPPPSTSPGRAGSINRAASPNNVGIALDPHGRVIHDEMAEQYQQRSTHHMQQQAVVAQKPVQQQQQPPQQPPQQQPQQQPQQHPSTFTHQQRGSYGGNTALVPAQTGSAYNPPASPQYQPPAPTNAYGHTQQGSWGQQPQQVQQQQQQQQSHHIVPYNQPPPPVQPQYTAQVQQPAQPQQLTYPVQQQQQQQIQNYQNSSQRGLAVASGGGYGGQQQYAQQPQQTYQQPQIGYHNHRSPSPQPPPPQPQQQQHQMMAPTGQTTEDGRGILFYVQALYDYQATIDEEFDFQAGDIIAVTATPEDGWWSGESLDEARRQRGRHVFPSNFVCLLE